MTISGDMVKEATAIVRGRFPAGAERDAALKGWWLPSGGFVGERELMTTFGFERPRKIGGTR